MVKPKLEGIFLKSMEADDALKEKDFDIDKRKIEIEESIKTLGIYNVNVKLHSNINASIKVWVVRE